MSHARIGMSEPERSETEMSRIEQRNDRVAMASCGMAMTRGMAGIRFAAHRQR
jgi:hypothetical protein